MYAISNQHRDEIIQLLESLNDLPGKDVRTINDKRKAGVLIKKLSKSKKVDYEEIRCK